MQDSPKVIDLQVRVGAGGGRYGRMPEEFLHDFGWHLTTQEVGGVGMTQHVNGERDTAACPQTDHQIGDIPVPPRRSGRSAPQVDEHIVAIEIAVFVDQIVGVEPDQ